MVVADAAAVSIDLPQLLQRNLVFPEVRLQRPVIFLEQSADGHKNWLLDRKQQDESARIRIDRLMLDQGKLGYDDVARKIRIRAILSTANAQPGNPVLVLIPLIDTGPGMADIATRRKSRRFLTGVFRHPPSIRRKAR